MSGHVESLFSAAYDGELSPDARTAFDRHLGECSACAAAFAEVTTAVDALREQPGARMPHPVRLPEGSPVPERRWFEVPARLVQGRRLLTGLTAAGLVAAAAVAAVVVVGHLNSGADTRSADSSGVSGSMSAAAPGAAIQAPLASPQSASLLPELAPLLGGFTDCSPRALPISKTEALEIPTGFPNHATEDNGVSTGVVATQASSFAPGGTVDIYARLIDDSGGAVSLPCTFLVGPPSASSSGADEVTVAVPTPVAGLTVDGQPLLQVTVPATAVAGQSFEIVVSSIDPDDTVVILTIQIS
ncbi:MAG: zf-HC2 domain-containing protein [Candidatus Dormibacteria bacterium]